MLQLKELTVKFGGLTAVDHVSLDVPKGQIVSLVGPNGAGKTTIFNAITGFGPVTEGSIMYKDENLVGLPTLQIAKRGITRTFQKTHIFHNMTVLENIVTASNLHFKSGFFKNIFKTPLVRKEERHFRTRAKEILDFCGIGHLKDESADNLAYGSARFLAIAIAVATEAEFLLLDEPAAGLNPVETESLMDLIKKINDWGHTIFLIEHDMKLVMNISNFVHVLSFGKLIASGLPAEISQNEEVIEAYLGTSTV